MGRHWHVYPEGSILHYHQYGLCKTAEAGEAELVQMQFHRCSFYVDNGLHSAPNSASGSLSV